MKQFFKFMFASMFGFILTIVIFIFIMVGIISSLSTKEEVVVHKKTVLVMDLDVPISDRSPKNPLESFDFEPFAAFKTLGLNDILSTIDKAKNDNRIEGIYMSLDIIPSGFSVIEEIRNALIDFKESGKFIITYSEVLTQKAYYLASVSDEIYLNPEGMLEFIGLKGNAVFIKGTLEKLEIKPQILRGKNNKFKSAVEPLILDKMSESSKTQIEALITSIWDHMASNIADEREIKLEDINTIAENMQIRLANDALKYKFVDFLYYKDQVLDNIKTRLEVEEIDDIKHITINEYKNVSVKAAKKKKRGKDKIAIVYASGDIVMGKGDEESIGSETISKAIRQARLDDKIKAIVLRVNSPGGSALASEIIWREVDLARKTKKVVVSMGNLAASGGYYISCAADTIVCDPQTITGSIGVFGVVFNMKDFFNNKLGITFDHVKTHEHADFAEMNRPLSEFEAEIIQTFIDDIYNTFLQHVADGRKLDIEYVDSIAMGRVWSGLDAKEIGLVDVIGGIESAEKIAAYMAGIEDYRVVYLPKQKDPIDQIIEGLTGNTKTSVIKEELGANYTIYEEYKNAIRMQGIQARIPFKIEIN
ncbi:signal peptide peptidase SppA [Bacteroidota bacterium]